MTICERCDKDKGDDFRKNRRVCRECDNELARQYRKALKEKEKPEFIICNKCGEKKTEFRINRGSCLDCERAHGRNYRKTTDKAKIWTQNNRERMSELQHNWYVENKTNIWEKNKERLKTDPDYKRAVSHGNAVAKLINGKTKTSKSLTCDSKRIRDWIQFQLKDTMSFDNYGKVWVADHVIPVASFLTADYKAEIILDWFNLQPIDKKQNLVKNKYIDYKQCMEHLENIKLYTKLRGIEINAEYIRELENLASYFAKHQVAGTPLESSDTTPDPKGSDHKDLVEELG